VLNVLADRCTLAMMVIKMDVSIKLPTNRSHHDIQNAYHFIPTSFKYSYLEVLNQSQYKNKALFSYQLKNTFIFAAFS
jgi:hypothetical protein